MKLAASLGVEVKVLVVGRRRRFDAMGTNRRGWRVVVLRWLALVPSRVLAVGVVFGLLVGVVPPSPVPSTAASSVSEVGSLGGGACGSVLARLAELGDCVVAVGLLSSVETRPTVVVGSPLPGVGLSSRAGVGFGVGEVGSSLLLAGGGWGGEAGLVEGVCSNDSGSVIDDPLGDWDGDGFSNVVEMYAPTDPCSASDVPVPVALVGSPVQAAVDSGPVAAGGVAVGGADGGGEPVAAVVGGDGSEPVVQVICPGFSFDDVLGDPDGDWDADGVSNKDEFYSNVDPCVSNGSVAVPTPEGAGTVTVCPEFSAGDVVADPDGDWDADGVSNRDEFYNGEQPCRFDDPAGRLVGPSVPVADLACAGFSVDDVVADPGGDWDGDRVSNNDEFYNNADPCRFDDPALRTVPVPVSTPAVDQRCSGFSVDDVMADLAGDWDGDRVSNNDEFYNNADPCRFDGPGSGLHTLLTDPIGVPSPVRVPTPAARPPISLDDPARLPDVDESAENPLVRAPQLDTPVEVSTDPDFGFKPIDRLFVDREDGSVSTSDLDVNVIVNVRPETVCHDHTYGYPNADTECCGRRRPHPGGFGCCAWC